MASKQQDTGTDIKSVLINLASILLLILPVATYLDRPNAIKYCGVVAMAIIVGLLAPPMGWRRPHPYSDDPNNRPYPRKKND